MNTPPAAGPASSFLPAMLPPPWTPSKSTTAASEISHNTAPRLTSRTHHAMQRLGVQKEDLVPRNVNYFMIEAKGNKEAARKTAEFYAKRREDMWAEVMLERAKIIENSQENPKASLTHPRLAALSNTERSRSLVAGDEGGHGESPGEESSSKARRISHLVNQARRQVAAAQESRARSLEATKSRHELRVERVMKQREMEYAARKAANNKAEHERRLKAEESRERVLKSLNGKLNEILLKNEKRQQMQQDLARHKKERLAHENAEEDKKRRLALERKNRLVEEQLMDLKRQQQEEDKKYEEHRAEELRIAHEQRLQRGKDREEKLKQAQITLAQEREQLQQRREDELHQRMEQFEQSQEVLEKMVQDHMERRRQCQKNALERMANATQERDMKCLEARQAQIQKYTEAEEAVGQRLEKKHQEWVEHCLNKVLKQQMFRDHATRLKSQNQNRREERHREADERRSAIKEQHVTEARLRHEELQRRKARGSPEPVVPLAKTPGPGHYLGTEGPWFPSRMPVIRPEVGTTLPPYPTPSPAVYSPRPELMVPHKGVPRL